MFGPEQAKKFSFEQSGPLSLNNPPQYQKMVSTFLIENIFAKYEMLRKYDEFMDFCFPARKNDNMKHMTVEITSDNRELERAVIFFSNISNQQHQQNLKACQ
jgi:hypothetical protein